MTKCNPAEKHSVLRYYHKPTVVSIIRKLTIAETVDVRNIAHWPLDKRFKNKSSTIRRVTNKGRERGHEKCSHVSDAYVGMFRGSKVRCPGQTERLLFTPPPVHSLRYPAQGRHPGDGPDSNTHVWWVTARWKVILDEASLTFNRVYAKERRPSREVGCFYFNFVSFCVWLIEVFKFYDQNDRFFK